jgi:dTDP-glucose pyrophosphorylase
VTTFVVVAAGRGSRLGRVGDDLPKCLVPLDGKAILSHQFELAPADAKLLVVTGYRATQIREFVTMAHPDRDVTFVHDEAWGAGPGASLYEAADYVPADDDMIWVACDTLWDRDPSLWETDSSWIAVAPIPAGTPAARWCRVVPTTDGRYVDRIDDKTPEVATGSLASTAFGYVVAEDLSLFWDGLNGGNHQNGEIQFSSGLAPILDAGQPIEVRHIRWLDVGDEAAYRVAQAQSGVYDNVKIGQATYVLPDDGRVVKFNADPLKISNRVARATQLEHVVPKLVKPHSETMMAYEYVYGPTGYGMTLLTPSTDVTTKILDWWQQMFWDERRDVAQPPNWYDTVMKFYRDKTFTRVMALPRELQSIALDAVTRVDWHDLVEGNVTGAFHGDMTYANLVFSGPRIVAIDWREDFAGETVCTDLRYDLAKLLSGTVFHWQNAAEGNFRYWDQGERNAELIRKFVDQLGVSVRDVEIIAALCLLNSSSLHAAPMDEILVARGARWLGQVT